MKQALWLFLFVVLIFTLMPVTSSRQTGISFGTAPGVQSRILSFTAVPRTIRRGDSATLAWETSGASLVNMESRLDADPLRPGEKTFGLPSSGTMTVEPQESTIYILECETESGETGALSSVSVQVR